MPVYRFYLLDDTDHPLRVIDTECPDDDGARRVARETLDTYAAATADLWQGLRHLEKIDQPRDSGAHPKGE